MKELFGGGFGIAISAGTVLLPIYAAVKDIQADKIFWGIVDIVTVVPGVIRGLMYLFGGL
ncbi:MAG: hypothetical protein Q4A60_08320 [Pasteurellaceae bacterium]|nr:hypothetical protein [Pasteurellaceae bacterium]